MKQPRDYSQYKNDFFTKLDFDFQEGRSLLDVGCGDCTDLEIFIDKYGLKACGIDVYKHEKVTDLQVEFALGSALDLPFGDGSFDYVFSHDMLHHVEDGRADRAKHIRCLSEMKRVTADGGYTIVVEANKYNPLFYPHMVLMRGHRHFSRSYFMTILGEVFDEVRFKTFEAHLYPETGLRLWKGYERAMERWAPPMLLAYNAAVASRSAIPS
jgi:ubiquinone/menaquinone biosynthesis C-methylase UbiE